MILKTMHLHNLRDLSNRSLFSLFYKFSYFSISPSIHSHYLSSPTRKITIGILRETKSLWERRCPIIPDHVQKLIQEGAKILIQPSPHRAIPDSQFQNKGAIITEDLSTSDIIIGIKEVPSNMLLPKKTYLFFSHTHKGQAKNMKMLKEILEKEINLIDYELITSANRKREVAFGTFAGYAGMIDGFHSLGRRMLALGYNSPFLQVAMAHAYPSLNHARESLNYLGEQLKKDGLPSLFSPFVVTFTGDGKVTEGAMSIFKHFPHEFISTSDLPSLFTSKSSNSNVLYAVHAKHQDYLFKPGANTSFDEKEYRQSPHTFQSAFSSKLAPYTSMLVTGHFWNLNYPRLLTSIQANALNHQWKKQFRMLTISDISCDIEGGIEFLKYPTHFEKPWVMYDPIKKEYHDNIAGEGVQIMAIDILPSELPIEASTHFSNSLLPFVTNLVKGNMNDQIKRAMITLNGKLEPEHQWLKEKLPLTTSVNPSSQTHHVIILGSGYVVGPALDYLLRKPNVRVTIASNNLSEAKKLLNKRDASRINIQKFELDSTSSSCHELLKQGDVIVSLLPATFHPSVAKLCIELGKSLVTASYISPAMQALHEEAKKKDLILFNEIGLDPGLDHLSAKKFMDSIVQQRGHLTGYASFCGGLPAPEHSDNPFGYKFSWSPLGALKAALNPSQFLLNGKVAQVPSSHCLKHRKPFSAFQGFALECIPNRDALIYQSLYGLTPPLHTLFRGTLRYPSYASILDSFIELGFMSEQPLPTSPMSWYDFVCHQRQSNSLDQLEISHEVRYAMEWLGMFDKTTRMQGPTPLASLCHLLQTKLVYEPGERDMVLMYHAFTALSSTGKEMKTSSSLCVYGEVHGPSAMAKTVGLPVGIAVELILEKKIQHRGVVGPFHKDIYEPMLDLLEKEGIVFTEKEGHACSFE